MFQRNRPSAPISAWWLVPIGVIVVVGTLLWGVSTDGAGPGRVEILPFIGIGMIVVGIVLGVRGERLRR